MTSAQFYVGIAVPSAIAFLAFMGVLLGFWLNNKRLDRVEAKLDAILDEGKKTAILLAIHEYRLNQDHPQAKAS